ncbi:uncharacterized protein LOC124165821 isoform X2 [Ischnura elegans]|uniref:uncharacterized protein LOC124165821 isoform X2 n=1 Tax=Ischnura elegans TaxID=197161 RepID=UPI001ED8A534|nr:uncharacterized protein LOC124165821 isoform X2 [Ischnura elegans]
MLPARNIPRMPSLESIGSCSLDADVTASECSEAVGITASQRTLHSISFVDFSPLRTTEDSGVQPALGPSDSADKIVDNSLSPHTSSPNTVTSPRPPSYVSLSCSISGYSPLAAYDSELRKGFRTGRDANQTADPSYIPVKQTLSAGDHENNNIRDTSGASGMENNKASVCSPNHRKPCVGARDMNGSLQSQNNGDEKGHNSDMYSYKSGPTESHAGTVRIVQFTSQNKSYVRTVTRTFDSGVHGSNATEEHSSSSNFITPSKSFIQQRVERLYGPGALAQGFFKRTSHRSVSSGGKSTSFSESGDDVVSPRPCASLPVLRHLRPEFRNQLPVRGTSPKVPPVVTIIPITVEGIEPSPDKEKDLSALEAEKEEDLCKSKVNDVIVTAPPDLCPAAPDVVLPPVLIEGAPDVTNGIAEVIISQESKPNDGVVKDGHYFIRLLKSEIARLTKLVDSAEEELARGVDGENPLPEEAAGWLRSAAGQARLLMRQKMQQFEGLCQKHLLQSPGEAFPTTLEDLAGFWDMVLLQVASVDAMFQEIDTLRASGWVETPSKTAPPKDGKVDSTSGSAAGGDGSKGHKKQTVRKPQLTASASSTKTSGAAKARDEARRKMMEERRRAMKERQKESAGEGSIQGEVEIFVPDNK